MKIITELNWNLLGLIISLFSFAYSISLEERKAIYYKNGCDEGNCEIVEINKLSHRRKRSTEEGISFSVRAFGIEKILNLKPSSDSVLVGPNTPVYFATTTISSIEIEKKQGMFNSKYKIYEDKENLAAFTIDTDSDELQVESGYLGPDNLMMTRLPNTQGNHYLAKLLPNDVETTKNYIFSTHSTKGNYSNKSIPKVIYPEILVIIDNQYYLRFKEEELFPYLLKFWSGVNLYFSTLKNPEYKLSIAGVIIPQDENVLDMNPSKSWKTHRLLVDYKIVLTNMNSWLKVVPQLISYDSYDTYILMTPNRDGIIEETSTAGLSPVGSACAGKIADNPHGGVIFDEGDFRGILTTVHELGHIFGADHDVSSCAVNSVMAKEESPGKKIWSECSKYQFQKALEEEDFSCLYNKPDLGDILMVEELNQSVSDSKPLTITSDMYNPDKLIVISHKKGFIEVHQIERNSDDDNKDLDYQELNVSIPSKTSLIFDPRIIHSTKIIIVNYNNETIHINTVDSH